MASSDYEVIVVGGGHNGLVAATYLARAGKEVLVLERQGQVGGAAVTEEIHPGFYVDTVLHNANMLRPQIVQDLFLKMYGFEMIEAAPLLFTPFADGSALALWPDPEKTAAALAALSPEDGARFEAYRRMMETFAGFLERAMARIPPDVGKPELGDAGRWLGTAAGLRLLGEREMYEFLRLVPMSVYNLMQEWFAHPGVQAALGTAGIWHLHQGPRASGTAFVLLYHALGHRAGGLPVAGLVRGGIGSLARALGAAAEDAGATVRTAAEVREICLEKGRASGVRLASGEWVAAPVVVSTANPYHTFHDLVGPAALPPTFNRAVGNIKFRGAVAKVNLALSGLPAFRAAEGADPTLLRGRIQIAPTLDYVERAFDAAKYGRYSEAPVLEATIPSLHDPALAPAGQHTMSVLVQYVPYALRGKTWAAERERLGETVVNTLAGYAPGLQEMVLQRQVLTPVDLEEQYGLYRGSVYHGEMTLDQLLFMRPVPGWGRYRTPIGGLYLGGAGAHPGGGITGEPGRLVAQAILADMGE